MTRRVIYARGFPYGAPLVMLRGGGLKISGVLGYLREEGFRWQASGRASHAYETYLGREDLTRVLTVLRDAYGCEILAKKGMDANYILNDFSEVQA
jgi:hypothetical protein